MVSPFAPLTLLAFAAAALAQGVLRIETPAGVTVCRPTQFTFEGGEPPYFLSRSAYPAGQPTAPPTIDFGEINASPFRWTANLPAGTSLFLRLIDSNGTPAESGSFTILEGSSTDCIGQEPDGEDGDDETPAPPAGSGSAPAPPAGTPSTPSAPGAGSSGAPSSASSGASTSSSARPTQSGAADDEEDGALSTFVSTGAIGLGAIAAAAILL
ncbi:hypothetical protein CC1G_12415 [Coprinopsis cinerea okayama7|uniref:Uncharacterized protein n=1 Tax=Coprinopsis cinerea (strain Okayama-7 / 130 / ATCC MYA-4618 / FGSC 9003) TaxID=240176 RepID=A8NU44_COPC7|nr:hypothetical protein CC1G_12415 [Coprinopsis cinerea okayama7\|eukprot:XP_001836374.1 hypothetical protein CC1G_12415 [Coprinopsis cinerea okayama7\